jgi:hypothetical protein
MLAKALEKCKRTLHTPFMRVGLREDGTPVDEDATPLETLDFDATVGLNVCMHVCMYLCMHVL